ncbi:MAG TPA: hypothetical protein EYG89_01665, partial [Bacteroidia bacterium]|nr:hypothetical protein [Bacteroidia bacterium]
MFKEEFNELAVAIERFVLEEKQRPKFESVSEEVQYYRNIVDEYMAIKSNISNIIDSIDQEKFINLFDEITNELALLNTTFEKYKTEFIVKSYVQELENFDNQSMLYERIYKFEKSLVIKPLIKVDIETIQEIIVYAKEYSNNTDKFYFFANNPFEIDERFNIVIPKRFEYDNATEFVNAVYNYLLGLLHTYKSINVDELAQMESLELLLKEKLYEFSDILRNASENKYQVAYGITPDEYYNDVTEILDTLQAYSDNLIETGIYRFNTLKNEFEILEKKLTQLKEYYYSHELFKSWETTTLFDNKLSELQDIIHLLEDGKINIDKKYVVDDTNIKTLVDEIVVLAREEKKRIFYTEKYNSSGIPTVKTFEFYQTDAFIQSIKKYYYELMTQNISRYSDISIDDYGDDSVDEYRIKYKQDYAKYNQFIAQDVYFMDEFEISEYISKIKEMQRLLKKTAELFFNASIKTSPLTYHETIENHYKIFLDKLASDLETIELKKINTILLNADTNRTEALKKLREIEKHVISLEQIIELSRRYVFLGMTDFINENIFVIYNNFYKKIKESFDKEEYIKVISDYNQFYKNSIFDFNMLYSLEKLAKSVETIFTEISSANAIFIDEQISGVPIHKENVTVSFMNDLFNDETYKVLRNEIFSRLDNFYQYVISSRENEKTFLINEKNLKKAYFDNQLIKLNYMRIYDNIMRISSSIENLDESTLIQYQWYNDEKEYLNSFDHLSKLDTLVLHQNRVLSELSKMIMEYMSNTNLVVDITENSISAIDEYITSVQNDIQKYEQTVEKIVAMYEYEKLIERKKELIKEHTESWVTLINDNRIKSPEKISYNEMETFEGSVPCLVEFKAKT